MAEIKVPTLGESVSEATVAKWFKQVGDAVAQDEPLVELETDKVTVEVRAESAGTLSEIVAGPGSEVAVGAILGVIGAAGAASAKKAEPAKAAAAAPAAPAPTPAPKAAAPAAPAPTAQPSAPKPPAPPKAAPAAKTSIEADYPLAPAVRHLVDEHGLDPKKIPASGKNGRLVKADVLKYLSGGPDRATKAVVPDRAPSEERVKMTRLRKRIAERLKEAQNTAAMLTTFNEADMSAVMALRNKFKDSFEKKHGVKMGFMSFFVKALSLIHI